jgi:hypothetical protein
MGKLVEINEYKICFIIAHKYFRGYESYLDYYVEQILNYYHNSLIIIVDNNSNYKEDIFKTLPNNKNIILLDNNILCKFEIGAYQVGLNYLMENDLINEYDYYVFSQDNFILKNKYDFNLLNKNKTKACPINSWTNDWEKMDVCEPVLKNLNLFNMFNESKLCWCNSFIVTKERIEKLHIFLKKIVIINRHQSEGSERYLGRILLELNDGIPTIDIDGDITLLKNKYDCWNVNPKNDINSFFVKIVQQKNEKTTDR